MQHTLPLLQSMLPGWRTVLADRTNRSRAENGLFNIAEYEEMEHDDIVIDAPLDDGDAVQDHTGLRGQLQGLSFRSNTMLGQAEPPHCPAEDSAEAQHAWRYRQSEHPDPI